MLIDWFTVSAQALNFLILVWLMKRFLYKPILNAINARETLIAAELADAALRKADAQKERDEFQHKNELFDQSRAALLTKAADDANIERQRLLGSAQKAATDLSEARRLSLQAEAKSLSHALSLRAQQEVFAIVRKALKDLADVSLEASMANAFVRRVRELSGTSKADFAEALRTSAEPALIRSMFDLPAPQHAYIQTALNETFSASIQLRYETASDLIGGIELTTHGQKVAWTIAEYLSSLEKGVGDLLATPASLKPPKVDLPEPAVAAKGK